MIRKGASVYAGSVKQRKKKEIGFNFVASRKTLPDEISNLNSNKYVMNYQRKCLVLLIASN